MYVKVTAGVPVLYSIWELRQDNPNTSFPSVMTDTSLLEWSIYPCVEGFVPVMGECEQAIRTDITLNNGVWTQNFAKEHWPLDQAEQYVHQKRDNLLSETDWMALSDVTLTVPWAAYRQSLRDVTSQPGFPYAVTWPTKLE